MDITHPLLRAAVDDIARTVPLSHHGVLIEKEAAGILLKAIGMAKRLHNMCPPYRYVPPAYPKLHLEHLSNEGRRNVLEGNESIYRISLMLRRLDLTDVLFRSGLHSLTAERVVDEFVLEKSGETA